MGKNSDQSNIEKSIGEKIQKQELTMRPKRFFVLKVIGTYLFLGVLFLASLFLISFLRFITSELQELRLFPWHVLALILVFVVISLKVLDRSIQRVHRTPRVITLFVLLTIVAALAFVIAQLSFLDEIFF